MTRPTAHALARAGDWSGPADSVTLDYRARLLRRRVIETAAGVALLVDLPTTTSCNHGDAFVTEAGGHVVVIAAQEPLLEVRGALHRLAWHIGNRHAPCQIEADRLLIQRDKVLRAMLEGLGATLRDVTAPFLPEGGAYGHGRTMGHTHATGTQDAGHGHHATDTRGHGQAHDHAHGDAQAHGHGDAHDHAHGHGDARAHDHGHAHVDDHGHAHGHAHGDEHGHAHEDQSQTHEQGQDAHAHGHPHRHPATQGAGRKAQATDGHGH